MASTAPAGLFRQGPGGDDRLRVHPAGGVPNAPSVYAPTVNPDLAAQRQRQVVDSLVDMGCITEQQAQEILGR